MVAPDSQPLAQLTNQELANLKQSLGANASAEYQAYVRFLISQQGDKFLENTISSTYLLLSADNYQALAASFQRQITNVRADTAYAKNVGTRLTDDHVAADWRAADSCGQARALAALAVCVPLAGLALDAGVAYAAYAVAAVAAISATAFLLASDTLERRDAHKYYWASPTTT